MTAGYVDDPTATRATVTSDGWLRTGDLGALGATGSSPSPAGSRN